MARTNDNVHQRFLTHEWGSCLGLARYAGAAYPPNVMEIPPWGYGLFLLLIGVLLIFALGTQRNIRKGNDLLRWLQGGLPMLGRKATLRWLGSTAAMLKIPDGAEPFREAEVVVVLEPRDLSLLWAWARSRGRRDFLILRGWLRRPPRFEVEAGDRTGWTGEDRLRKLDWEAWREADWGLEGVRVAHSEDADPVQARRWWEALAEASGGVWRLSVRRDHPHLEVHVLPPPPGPSAERLIEAFREVGRTASRGP
jgi:hypothetical protein